MAFLGQKVVSSAGYMDFVAAGLIKAVEERALAATPVGNGTILSGVVKMVIGYGAHRVLDGGIIGNGTSIAFTVDGIEDLLQATVIPMIAGVAGGQEQAW